MTKELADEIAARFNEIGVPRDCNNARQLTQFWLSHPKLNLVLVCWPEKELMSIVKGDKAESLQHFFNHAKKSK